MHFGRRLGYSTVWLFNKVGRRECQGDLSLDDEGRSLTKSARGRPSLFQQPFLLLGLRCCRRVFEFGDQMLELRAGAENLQIVVGHQGIGVFIPTIEGFT
jgi:hypothetical protein